MNMRNPRQIGTKPWILPLLGALALAAGCTGSAKNTGSSTPSNEGRSYPGFGGANESGVSYSRAKDSRGSTAATARPTRPSPPAPTSDSYGAKRSYGAAQQYQQRGGRVAPRFRRIYRHHRKMKEATPGERPGLATKAGELRHSPVERQSFSRATPNRPWGAVAIRYNNLAGLYAQVKHRVRYTRCATCAGGYRLYCRGHRCPLLTRIPVRRGIEVWVEDGNSRRLPGLKVKGRTYVMGRKNARYQIAIRNTTNRRFEIVASVDGLDVVTRRPASLRRRGYILDPNSTLRIDGFRVNTSRVAADRKSVV